eukprot:c20578_g1_i1.p1 GENE.c20578_g1_i1~~c20578_g1_i1.p1  ORF type:complete len:442 (+),score=190.93 c20578_g1_i1:28-1326(+)
MRQYFYALLIVSAIIGFTHADSDCASLNYCSAHGQCQNGVCVCHSGWGFDDCSLSTTGCESNCFGHGQCLNGTCSCTKGFVGELCNQVTLLCPQNCSGHGICHEGSCVCLPGLWTGDACDVEIYSCPLSLNNCTGNGECAPITQTENAQWVCNCFDGFCGESCDKVCGKCANNCSGHGICFGTECTCDIGFGGVDCSFVEEIYSCPNNCSGRGHCKQVNATSTYKCFCEDCFSGADCSKTRTFCPGNCSGQGVCQCDGTCSCQNGYTGVACEQIIETCSSNQFCSGNGLCNNGTCKCNPGFAGKYCSLACHTGGGNSTVGCNADKNHGTCVANADSTNASCVCKPEYKGVGCQLATTTNTLDDYVNGWNPIGTIIIGFVGAAVVLLIGGFVFNHIKGKRGLSTVPGADHIRSKLLGSSEFKIEENQRNASNY